MKALDIALKDLLRAWRSAFAVAMMLVVPLLINGLFYLAFGGLARGETSVQATRVLVVNADQGASGFVAGDLVVDTLADPEMAELLDVQVAEDEAVARQAVESGEAGVAVLIPANLTEAVAQSDGRAAITLVQDPTLTLGPGVVRSLVEGLLDGLYGSRIAVRVAEAPLAEQGLSLSAQARSAIVQAYGSWAETQGEALHEGTSEALVASAPASAPEQPNQGMVITAQVMVGMLLFFSFFTGASTAETILQEEEEGTLARLFTTPTARSTILAGKFGAVLLTVAVQMLVLAFVSSLIFGINWGQPLPFAMAVASAVVAAAGFGLFVMSLVRTTRQSGPVLGGVMSVTGMAGGLMTTGFTNLPAAFSAISLFTPQGWALRAWKLSAAGAGAGEMLWPAVGTLLFGLAFFAAGVLFFRKRLA
ncbi:MAG: ABC transporter permease [Anaerolineae bacterium]